MKILDYLEIFFLFAGAMSFPFIVMGSYFNFVKREERWGKLEIFFLVISIIYALIVSYFAWRNLIKSVG